MQIQIHITPSLPKCNDHRQYSIMKRNFILFFTAVLVLLTSCEEEAHINFGFDSTIKKFSDGMIIADIRGSYEKIYLHGIIKLSEGEMHVNLLNANGMAVYTKTLQAPVNFSIYETFFAEPGYWQLSYKSNNGVGEIDLHLRN
jgi:hypothetical protein